MNLFNESRSQGPVTHTTRIFFVRKTIQRTYNFLVRFDLSKTIKKFDQKQYYKPLFEYHAVGVELPSYDFKKEEYRIGNFVKNFPVLDHNGFEFTIQFEEDDVGTISNFIDNLVRLNIDSNGYYRNLSDSIIDDITVEVHRNDGVVVCAYQFKTCFFLKASTPTYKFETNDKVQYDITFNADHMVKFYEKAHLDPNYENKYVQEADQDSMNFDFPEMND